MSRRRLLARVASLVALAAAPAIAHLEVAQGRLLDLVQRSDVMVVAKVRRGGETVDDRRLLPVTVLSEDGATARRATLDVPARLAVQPGRSYAFFVTRSDDSLKCIHPPGTVLAAPHRGREYVEFDRAMRPLLPDAHEAAADVLLLALRADARELRFHAALALLDAVHGGHPLDASQRGALREILADQRLEDSLRPVLEPLAVETRAD